MPLPVPLRVSRLVVQQQASRSSRLFFEPVLPPILAAVNLPVPLRVSGLGVQQQASRSLRLIFESVFPLTPVLAAVPLLTFATSSPKGGVAVRSTDQTSFVLTGKHGTQRLRRFEKSSWPLRPVGGLSISLIICVGLLQWTGTRPSDKIASPTVGLDRQPAVVLCWVCGVV